MEKIKLLKDIPPFFKRGDMFNKLNSIINSLNEDEYEIIEEVNKITDLAQTNKKILNDLKEVEEIIFQGEKDDK